MGHGSGECEKEREGKLGLACKMKKELNKKDSDPKLS